MVLSLTELELWNVVCSPNSSSLNAMVDTKWLTLRVSFCVLFWYFSSFTGFLLVLPFVTPFFPLSSNFWAILPCLVVLAVAVHTYSHNCFPNPLVLLLFPPHFTSSVLLQAAAASLAQKRLNSKVQSIFSTESGMFPQWKQHATWD